MPSLLSELMGTATGVSQMNDRTIANQMLAGSKAVAQAYLTATVESATPEVRALYTSNLNKALAGHAMLTELAVKREWYQPYEMPEQQLVHTYQQAESVVENRMQS
ncbi:spore coat protein [Heliophilum fasciatum]|uniref:Coat F domain-containing protein n=1 Tax=Heliophilum fasciatum TaxID=35700 RepID=A0A4R2RWL8_9FIRM|nr:spore coat protein [Heliophilum fasciatum]MCW2278009.1 spore coat protein CotF [Heliophilum fasciatum]TCP64371.1 coat F domain-containing protein [Heliophilum fasciatum]